MTSFVTGATKGLTVFIGRFSPFHNGHAAVLERAIKTSANVLVLIGSSARSRSTKNPFTFSERMDMINDWIDSQGHDRTNVRVRPLYDEPYNDQEWIRGVQRAVNEARAEIGYRCGLDVKHIDVHLTGCDKDASSWYLNAFGNFFRPDFVEVQIGENMNATTIRRVLFGSDALPSEDLIPKTTLEFLRRWKYGASWKTENALSFRATEVFENLTREYEYIEKYKASWKDAPYPVQFLTCDAAVIQSGHILVCVRENFPGRGLYALPGGFLEGHERFVEGAIRELKEETKIELSDAQLRGSIKAHQIFDDPNRSLRGPTRTVAYLFKLDDSKPLPKVKPQKGEVQRLMWLPIADALADSSVWFEDHYWIVKWAVAETSKY